MLRATAFQERSPELIFGIMTAYQRSESLKAAIELDLFTAVGSGADTVEALAKRCEASERGVRALADYLVALGLLGRSRDRYFLTRDAATFLDRSSPEYMADAINFFMHPNLMDHYRSAASAIRCGGTIDSDGGITGKSSLWVEFARAMASAMTPVARELATISGAGERSAVKVLDVAAGHGMFGIALAEQNPEAWIVALDSEDVLKVARENAARAGVDGRFQTIPGNALEVDFGDDYDVALIANFLHQFDPLTCENFLARVRLALKSGGRAIALEFVINEDRISPPASVIFGMTMLVGTPAGRAYTFGELKGIFQRAGFRHSEMRALASSPEKAILSYNV